MSDDAHWMDGWQEITVGYRCYRYRVDGSFEVEHATRNGYQPVGKKVREGIALAIAIGTELETRETPDKAILSEDAEESG